MKHHGKKFDTLATAEALIPRRGDDPLRLKIRAIPFGFGERLREEVPAPRPPVVKKGGRGASEERVLYQDPGYLREVLKHNARLNALVIHHALGADKSITFDAAPDLPLIDLADAVLNELAEAGFTEGDIVILADQIDLLSNNGAGQVEEARNRFLSEAIKDKEDGDSPTTTE